MSRLRMIGISAVLAVFGLAGCSTMPEWTKPSSWVDGVSGDSDEAKAPESKPASVAADTKVAAPAGDPVIDPLATEPEGPRIKPTDKPTEFPNVNAQPAARQVLTTDSQRREIRDSLVADRDNAQHTADELRGGTQPAAAPPPPAAAKPAAKPKPATEEPEE